MALCKDWTVVLPTSVFTFAVALTAVGGGAMIEQKTCSPSGVPASINDFICNDTAIMGEVSEIATTKTALGLVMSAASAAIFGYLHDTTGRNKLLLFVGIFGQMASSAVDFLSSYYWSSSPWIAAITESILSGLFGEVVVQLGANCLIIEQSPPEERSLRLQVYMCTTIIVGILGGVLGTLLLTNLGYQWMLGLAVAANLVAAILVAVVVDEERSQIEKKSWQESMKRLKVVFKSRPNIAVIWIMLFTNALLMTCFLAEVALSFYFLQLAFHFTMTDGIIYGVMTYTTAVTGSFLVPILFKKAFSWSDFSTGIMASVFNCAFAVSSALVRTRKALYMAVPLDLMKFTPFPIPNSVISKCVEKDELGTFFGMGSILGICLPFGVNYVYHYVFADTSTTNPGAFNFLSAGASLLVMISFWICSCLYIEPDKKVESPRIEE